MSDKHLFFGFTAVMVILGIAIGLPHSEATNKLFMGAWAGMSYLMGVMSEKARKQ